MYVAELMFLVSVNYRQNRECCARNLQLDQLSTWLKTIELYTQTLYQYTVTRRHLFAIQQFASQIFFVLTESVANWFMPYP